MFYAQLNEENICAGVSQLSGKVINDKLIELNSFDVSILGKKYADGNWENVPRPEPEPQKPTQLDRIEEAINKSQEDIIDNYTLELIESGVL